MIQPEAITGFLRRARLRGPTSQRFAIPDPLQTKQKPHILVTFGTRPEAIKMFPVVQALRDSAEFRTSVVVTAQHRELLDQVLELAGIVPDIDLDLMEPAQNLDALASRIITSFGAALDRLKPDRVLVHGDTLTTMAASIACYFRQIPVGHVEAGLRSGNMYSPWPEEGNRKITGAIADLHFAPTLRAARALERENIPSAAIHITGNTAIDALHSACHSIASGAAQVQDIDALQRQFGGKRIIAVTAHRRENFGEGMTEIASALRELADRHDVAILFPLHPNPQAGAAIRRALDGCTNIALLPPLGYASFVRMMEVSHLILTDSGGIQEEAPSLGKPVLVMRHETERPEAIEAGTARLVGPCQRAIVSAAVELLEDSTAYEKMAKASNPFGDGNAARRIVEHLRALHASPSALTSSPDLSPQFPTKLER